MDENPIEEESLTEEEIEYLEQRVEEMFSYIKMVTLSDNNESSTLVLNRDTTSRSSIRLHPDQKEWTDAVKETTEISTRELLLSNVVEYARHNTDDFLNFLSNTWFERLTKKPGFREEITPETSTGKETTPNPLETEEDPGGTQEELEETTSDSPQLEELEEDPDVENEIEEFVSSDEEDEEADNDLETNW